jgi:putative endonuclease
VGLRDNQPANGTLYVGVTRDLIRRVWEHREGIIAGFTERYGLKRLVYYESHDSIVAAITREKQLKHQERAWEARLILEHNPGWADLYPSLL